MIEEAIEQKFTVNNVELDSGHEEYLNGSDDAGHHHQCTTDEDGLEM